MLRDCKCKSWGQIVTQSSQGQTAALGKDEDASKVSLLLLLMGRAWCPMPLCILFVCVLSITAFYLVSLL